MGIAFDACAERPEHIQTILDGLDRYNPETIPTFQDYVALQCETQTYDCFANLALLKLYQLNPHRIRDETMTNILTKTLTVFPSPDFSLCLSLFPVHVLDPSAGLEPSSLAESVQKLSLLHSNLDAARYEEFWSTLEGDDVLSDLTADVAGFEELMRVRIVAVVQQSVQRVDRSVLEGWLNLRADKGASSSERFEKFVTQICDWTIEGQNVLVPLNKENEAKGSVVRENVAFEQFGRVIRRAYEQPA